MNHDPQHPDDERLPAPERDGDDAPGTIFQRDNGPHNYTPTRGDV